MRPAVPGAYDPAATAEAQAEAQPLLARAAVARMSAPASMLQL